MGLLNVGSGGPIVDGQEQDLAFAERYVFLAGTDSLVPIYRDADLTEMVAQPLYADENGVFEQCYVVDGLYRIQIRDRDQGTLLSDIDNIIVNRNTDLGYVMAFGTVAEMLADQTLSYATEAGRARISPGQRLLVTDGDHTYRIRPEGVTDHHLETRGGIKLDVLSVENGYVATAFGAIYDGFFDNSPVLQRMIDVGVLDICLDAKGGDTVGMGSPILLHGSAGLRVRGLTTKAKLKPLTDMAFDSSRLEGLGLPDIGEYEGRRCFFIITEYDGENGRYNKAARDYAFHNLSTQILSGPVREISLVSSPHASHIKFAHLRLEGLKYLYDGWLLSNSRSRHYHIDYAHIRLMECVSLTSDEYVEGNQYIARNGEKASEAAGFGTSKNLHEVTFEASREGLKFHGQNYSQVGPFSLDNNWPGNFALDIFDSEIGFGVIGMENRLRRIRGESGGGAVRIKDSIVSFQQLTLFGGDGDGNSSAGSPITDYDDGSGTVDDSLFVIDNSRVYINALQADLPRAPNGSQWPIVVKNGSTLQVNLAVYNGIAGPGDFDVRDTSVVHLRRADGSETWVFGPDAPTYGELQNAVATGGDDKTCIGNPDLDVRFDLQPNVPCRVNQGAAGGTDPSDFGLPPAVWGGSYYGLLTQEGVGQYRALVYRQSDGRSFSRFKGASWGDWRQMSGPLPELAAADLANAGHAINTSSVKMAGARVWDSTNRREMRARGAGATAAWDDLTGTASVTPT